MTKSERTKHSILEAASYLFYKQGFDNTTQQDIADRAGINRGLIYHYFKNKDTLATIIFTTFISDFFSAVRSKMSKFEQDAILISITPSRPFFKYLLAEDSLLRLYHQLTLKKLLDDFIQKEIYEDLLKEISFLNLSLTENELYVFSGLLKSIELSILELMISKSTDMVIDDIITIYNDLHLSMLKISDRQKENYIQKSRQLAQSIKVKQLNLYTVAVDIGDSQAII